VLRRALIEGAMPTGLAPATVRAAVVELWGEAQREIQQIKDPEKIADLVLLKALNWIERAPTPVKPVPTPEYSRREK
jgi:hypothetical protein